MADSANRIWLIRHYFLDSPKASKGRQQPRPGSVANLQPLRPFSSRKKRAGKRSKGARVPSTQSPRLPDESAPVQRTTHLPSSGWPPPLSPAPFSSGISRCFRRHRFVNDPRPEQLDSRGEAHSPGDAANLQALWAATLEPYRAPAEAKPLSSAPWVSRWRPWRKCECRCCARWASRRWRWCLVRAPGRWWWGGAAAAATAAGPGLALPPQPPPRATEVPRGVGGGGAALHERVSGAAPRVRGDGGAERAGAGGEGSGARFPHLPAWIRGRSRVSGSVSRCFQRPE